MQEELEHKSVVLATNTTKLTGRTLARLMSVALRQMQKSHSMPKQGKQSLKQLAKGGSLTNVEITDENIKAFEPIARKYNISYSLKRDDTSQPPHWLVFFRAKDADAMTAAFKEFTNKMVKREKDKTSTRESMRELGDTVKNTVRDKTRHKQREGLER